MRLSFSHKYNNSGFSGLVTESTEELNKTAVSIKQNCLAQTGDTFIKMLDSLQFHKGIRCKYAHSRMFCNQEKLLLSSRNM